MCGRAELQRPCASPQELKFTGPLLADIFLGKITIVERPGDCQRSIQVSVLPESRDYNVAHRSDGSGTTYVFVDFLVERCRPSGNREVGVNNGSELAESALGGKGNEGVAALNPTDSGVAWIRRTGSTRNRTSSDTVRVQNLARTVREGQPGL